MRCLLALAVVAAVAPAHALPDLMTTAEKTNFARTGRYDEVERLCAEYERAYAPHLRCERFGTTPEGRPLLAIVASKDGVLDPATARQRARPVVLVEAGIHAGEIDGKDAGFIALRELLRKNNELLGKVTLVFVPVFNVDGHEQFAPHQRPNQNGPAETGFRTTAQRYNLNRDFTKVDTIEMAAMLALLHKWDPIVYVDLHVTDGAQFQHRIAYLSEPSVVANPALGPMALALRQKVGKRLADKGHLPLVDFYPSFRKDDDPASGFDVYDAPPRFSTAYWGLQNRIGVLVETHSWQDYKTRVSATRDAILDTLAVAAEDARAYELAARAAGEAGRSLGGKPYVLAWKPSEKSHVIDFLGYAYRREPSPVSTQLRTIYDPATPSVWKVPLFDDLQPSVRIVAPRGGYVVPPAEAVWLREKLVAHGIVFRVLGATQRDAAVETWRASEVTFHHESFEGHLLVDVKGDWSADRRELRAGSLYVPIDQPLGKLVMQLLEPMARDSFVAWGHFNRCFERKEYMEDYVAEAVAERMLRDPAVRAAFDARVATDPAFAKDPNARLEFFYRRHPSWDAAVGRYPIVRVDAMPTTR